MSTSSVSAEILWKKLPWSLLLEALWLIPAAFFSWLAMRPLLQALEFSYLWSVLLFLMVSFTAMRHLVFFKALLFYRYKWVKFGVFLLNMHLIVLILHQQEEILQMVDLFDIHNFGKLRSAIGIGEQGELMRYLGQLVTASATAAIILLLLMELRLIFSYWKVSRHRFSDMMQE